MKASRPYKITTEPPMHGGARITAEDHVETRLDLPAVLPPERMSGLLQAELGRRHFTPNADGDMERERDGVRVVVDPDTGDVTISAQMDEDRPPPPVNDSPCG